MGSESGGPTYSDFGKWWSDPKKHYKRINHWLPHLRTIANGLDGLRNIRYFTLCARSMIDVFMLVADKVLRIDGPSNAIRGVQFCECVADDYIEIREMIAREDSGFFGQLEDVALFADDEFTAQFPTPDDIALALEDEGLPVDQVDRLQLKRTYQQFQASFPYDYINLDFCQYYYPQPPDVFRITETVSRFLDWQRNVGAGSPALSVDEFILAVTCRYDSQFPKAAEEFLVELVRENCVASKGYNDEIQSSRGVAAVDQWVAKDPEDFFLSAWPKDVARIAKEFGWTTEILDYVYYQRPADESVPYISVCLVARFVRAKSTPDYLPAAVQALDRSKRKLIGEIDPNSDEGKALSASLDGIRIIRNEQARRVNRPELPAPT